MPVVDVSVIKAFNVSGVPIKKSFCVYVRLQGQAMRTNTHAGKKDEVVFNERFRFQYRPERSGREKNQLFVELWTKSMLSQSCVSVAWIDMDAQNFVQGTPITFNMHGGFEGKQATVMVLIVPVDFGTTRPATQALPPQQQQQQQDPFYGQAVPAVGVPIESASPYPTAQYLPQQQQQPPQPYLAQPYYKTDPITGQPIPTSGTAGGSCNHGCEAAPLPPPGAFAGQTMPPPLYGGAPSRNDNPSTNPTSQGATGNNGSLPPPNYEDPVKPKPY